MARVEHRDPLAGAVVPETDLVALPRHPGDDVAHAAPGVESSGAGAAAPAREARGRGSRGRRGAWRGGRTTSPEEQMPDHGRVAASVNRSRPLRMASRASVDPLTPWRSARYAGALYVSHTWPRSSSQARAFMGRSMPIVWLRSIKGAPTAGFPKMSSAVGRMDRPRAFASAV